MKINAVRLGVILGILAALLTAQTNAQSLGTAENFAALGASTVTEIGATTIVNNVGVSPGSAITDFPPGRVINGAIHAADGPAT